MAYGWVVPALQLALAGGTAAYGAYQGNKAREEDDVPDEVRAGMQVLERAMKRAGRMSGGTMPLTLGNNFMRMPTPQARMAGRMISGLSPALMGAPMGQPQIPMMAQMAPFLQAILGNEQMWQQLNNIFTTVRTPTVGGPGSGFNADSAMFGAPKY